MTRDTQKKMKERISEKQFWDLLRKIATVNTKSQITPLDKILKKVMTTLIVLAICFAGCFAIKADSTYPELASVIETNRTESYYWLCVYRYAEFYGNNESITYTDKDWKDVATFKADAERIAKKMNLFNFKIIADTFDTPATWACIYYTATVDISNFSTDDIAWLKERYYHRSGRLPITGIVSVNYLEADKEHPERMYLDFNPWASVGIFTPAQIDSFRDCEEEFAENLDGRSWKELADIYTPLGQTAYHCQTILGDSILIPSAGLSIDIIPDSNDDHGLDYFVVTTYGSEQAMSAQYGGLDLSIDQMIYNGEALWTFKRQTAQDHPFKILDTYTQELDTEPQD